MESTPNPQAPAITPHRGKRAKPAPEGTLRCPGCGAIPKEPDKPCVVCWLNQRKKHALLGRLNREACE